VSVFAIFLSYISMKQKNKNKQKHHQQNANEIATTKLIHLGYNSIFDFDFDFDFDLLFLTIGS
jgi:hypothetical protein